ncbi:uncharacterized protein LOC110622488 [Manihot esculenta]|uniref:Uncharacterized protein n=1 Tax=Manihot esculenta TaxID=3983 RepID=A0ACB7H2T4_MANES|nr:uncharacterized protein LOC110622488 [Manihot esculenta]KAG8647014.1 hypothetical protein MANES_09G052900v8 [Manihot esculenta]
MDPAFRHRFLNISPSAVQVNGNEDELNEHDVLWTNDFAEQSPIHSTTANESINRSRASISRNSGILAALPESNHHSVLYRKPSIPSSSKSIPLIPRPPQGEREYASQSVPGARKLNQSAPMNVPVLSIAMAKQRNSKFREEDDDDGGGDEEILPPHEIVARASRNSPKTTFSVLEGVGRTLKGRDLRQVRNAVWRQTGFLD